MDVSILPSLNALLNATAGLLLVAGLVAIKRGRIDTHRRFMVGAFIVSAAFLVSYVIYHAQAGSKPFPGSGWIRTVYFAILVPHIILAAVVLPLAIVTLWRGLARSDVRHRRIARITLPIWLFVSVSGVLVYLMLYQMY